MMPALSHSTATTTAVPQLESPLSARDESPPSDAAANVVVLFHAELGQQLPDIAPPPQPSPTPQRAPYGYD
jgi:hypothetical protein